MESEGIKSHIFYDRPGHDSEDGKSSESYLSWKKTGSLIKSWIRGTLMEEVTWSVVSQQPRKSRSLLRKHLFRTPKIGEIFDYAASQLYTRTKQCCQRKHRHKVVTGLTLLFHAYVLHYLSVDSFTTAVSLIIRMPRPVLHNPNLYQNLFSKNPYYNFIKTFDCLCFPFIRTKTSSKFQPKLFHVCSLVILHDTRDTDAYTHIQVKYIFPDI